MRGKRFRSAEMAVYKPLDLILKNLYSAFEFEDIIFLCETAIAEGDNSYEVVYYLALSLEHIGRSKHALRVIKKISRQTFESRFLLIKLFQRTKKYTDMKAYFSNELGLNLNDISIEAFERFFGHYTGSVLKIIAESHHVCGNYINKKKYLLASLKSNIFLWSNVEKLCHARENLLLDDLLWPLISEDSITSVLADNVQFPECSDPLASRSPKKSPSRIIMKSTPLKYNLRRSHATGSGSSLQADINTSIKPFSSFIEPLETRIIEAYKCIGLLLSKCEIYSPDYENLIKTIPETQKNRCYVQALFGSAHFHLLKFDKAEKNFHRVMIKDPSFTFKMDEYSSTLWQLKEIEKLKLLFENLSLNSPLAFQTWTVGGNLASLKNQSHKAISYLKRSKFLNEDNPYSSTILAQEKLQMEDISSAEFIFKSIITIDPLHYQAWYYLGKIAAKQHKYKEAIFNLQQAQNINPYNTLINSLLGYSALKCNKFDLAVASIDKAISFEPRNLLLYYEKAYIFFECKKYKECLELFYKIRDDAPLDCTLLLLGTKTFQALDMVTPAIHCCAKIIRNFRTNKAAVDSALTIFNSFKYSSDEELQKLYKSVEIDILEDIKNL